MWRSPIWGDVRDRCRRITQYVQQLIFINLCSLYTLMRRTRDTIIGSRIQVQIQRDTFCGAIQVERWLHKMSRNSDSLLRPTTNDQFGQASHDSSSDSLLTDFPSRWCCSGKLWLGVSKDTKSSVSLRKALVRKVREMDVVVNWLNFELVVGKGC